MRPILRLLTVISLLNIGLERAIAVKTKVGNFGSFL
jgi:hypothetical protein